MSVQSSTVTVPAGIWELDPAHTSVSFSARHLMVSKVRGRFGSFSGTITVGDHPLISSVTATIDTASIDTKDEQRDGHLKSPDFLNVDQYPTITFVSTAVRDAGDGEYDVDGNLTILDATRTVTLKVVLTGVEKDPWGGTRVGFEATTEFSRKDFGLEWNVALESGGVLVGDKVKVELEIEAVQQVPPADPPAAG
jgi:polyisoprenoid-binding protein YceI